MKNLYQKFKLSILFIIFLLIVNIIVTTLEYIGVSYRFSNVILYILNITLIIIFSYIKTFNKKMYSLNFVIKTSLKIWISIILINMLMFNKISFKIIYGFLIILISTLIGNFICKKKQKKLS